MFSHKFWYVVLCITTLCIGNDLLAQKVYTNGAFMYLDYKPFFPIGLYDFPEKRNDDAMWKEASEAGFNFKLSKTPGKYGMKISRPIPYQAVNGKNVSVMEVQKGAEIQQKLAQFISEYEKDTTLLCWHAPDEPSWFGPTATVLRNGYTFLKERSQKPVWLNIGPSFTAVNHYTPGVSYLDACDIISEDIYPVPDKLRKDGQAYNLELPMVGEHSKKIVEMSSVNGVQKKPLWMVLQAFGWKSLNKMFKNPDTHIAPTLAELRYMAYDAIVNGATGIVYWGLEFEKLDQESSKILWNNVKMVAGELKANYPILTSQTEINNSYLKVITPDSTTKPIKTLLRLANNKIYVIAVNASDKTLEKVTFDTQKLYKASVSQITETYSKKAVVVNENASWSDKFGPYDVKIYETNLNYAFLRKFN
jgi:hypothetical protein